MECRRARATTAEVSEVRSSKQCSRWLVHLVALTLFGAAWTDVSAAQVTLVWDPPVANQDGSTPPDIAGYRVYCGTSSGAYAATNDAGMATSITVTGLDASLIYFFAVTAYSSADVESAFSGEVQWTCDADADGMPDLWERLSFGGEEVPGGGALEDFDDDGCLNVEEYIAGTSPTDGASGTVLTWERSGTNMVLRLQTIAAAGGAYDGLTRVYTIDAAPARIALEWTPLSGCERIVAAGQLASHAASCGEDPYLFRARVALE